MDEQITTQSSSKKEKLFKKQLGLSKDSNEHIRYVTYRNADNRVKQHAKKTYYAELVVKHQNNAKELWKIINEVSHEDNDKKLNYKLTGTKWDKNRRSYKDWISFQ